jgi:glutathione synthase/RimK-type ligase-like ATP-grasp enzyme
MSKLLVVPYSSASESAKVLANLFGCKRMKLENSKTKDRNDLSLINWGNSTVDLSHLPSVKVYNKPENVALASNKTKFFQTIEEFNEKAEDSGSVKVNIPDWTTSVRTARQWYNDGFDIVCRHTVQSHSGDGIHLAEYREDVRADQAVPKAPLYTKYMKKRDEYRVHVVAGKPIFVQRKAIDSCSGNVVNYQIRNRKNGFLFVVQDLDPDPSVISNAVNAVNALGLDFGAVDVIWNERRQLATVVEVNTACSLHSKSGKARYYNALKALMNSETQTLWFHDVPSLPVNEREDKSAACATIERDLQRLSNNVYSNSDSDTYEFIRNRSLYYNCYPVGSKDVYIGNDAIALLMDWASESESALQTIQGLSAFAHYYNQEDGMLVYELISYDHTNSTCRIKVIPNDDLDSAFNLELDIPTTLVFGH